MGAVEGPHRMGQHFPASRQNSPRLAACRAGEQKPDCFGRQWNGLDEGSIASDPSKEDGKRRPNPMVPSLPKVGSELRKFGVNPQNQVRLQIP
jgi:hypothetical protein